MGQAGQKSQLLLYASHFNTKLNHKIEREEVMRKTLTMAIVLVIGTLILTLVDDLIGMIYQDVSLATEYIHKVVYMVWGGLLLTIFDHLSAKI